MQNFKEKNKFIYESLAEEIKYKIESGTYKAGDKLPSIRDYHKQLNLSISTVYKAYIELETSGVIEARPKSGYYVRAIGRCLAPPILKKVRSYPARIDLSSVVHTVHEAISDESMLALGGLMISPELLPFKHFSRIAKSVTNDLMKKMLFYSPPAGMPEFRKEIAKRYSGFAGNVGYEEVTVTNGCMEALAVSLQSVVKAGDTIAIETPSFFMVLQLLASLGVYVVEIPTNPITGVSLSDIKAVVEKHDIKACLLMPNFQNPLGALMPDDEKKKIVRYISKQNIPLIEDDIYSELYYEKNRPLPLKTFDKEGWVITCSSFSKTLSPGLRVGWIISGKRFNKRINDQKTAISISNSTLDQYILLEFLKSGGYDRHLRSLRTAVKKQCLNTAQAISRYFPEGTRLAQPHGGAFLWIQLPEGANGFQLFQEALKENIAILPGNICSNSSQYDNCIRLSCGFPFNEKIEAGIVRLGEMVSAQMIKAG